VNGFGLFAALLVGLTRPAAAADATALRAALASELRALPGDALGLEDSDLLLSSSITLSVGLTSPGPGERAATATYVMGTRVITVDSALAREPDAAAVARRIAPTLVHELEHARADLRAPGAPVALEGEWTAYAAEAAFVRRRLAADPRYLERGRRLGRLGDNYAFSAAAGKKGLDGVRRACERDGLFKGLKPASQLCGGLRDDERRRCDASASYYRDRLEQLRAALAAP
jgi:hypothetical protein